MADCQITCILKHEFLSSHEHITHVGNPRNSWMLTREDAIHRIENKIDSFFTIDPKTGKRAEVGVRRDSGKAPYLQTYADGVWNNNLLSMDRCPLRYA